MSAYTTPRVRLSLRHRLLRELNNHHHGRPVHFFHLSEAAPSSSGFAVRETMDALVAEGLAATCPQRGRDYWRALAVEEQPCLLCIDRRGVGGRARPTAAQSEQLDQLIRARYPLGGPEAVLAVTDGVTDNMVKVRASRMGLRVGQ